MPGRTERVSSKEIEDQWSSTVYEAEELQRWIKQLTTRAKRVAARAKKNKFFRSEYSDELAEINSGLAVLKEAERKLTCFSEMVKRREKSI